jgi:hypothetical protein
VVECLNGNIGRAARRQELDGGMWDGRGIGPRIAVISHRNQVGCMLGLPVGWSFWLA